MAKEKSSTKNKAEAESVTGANVSGADLDTLRDILFGNQARSTDDRLARLERELASVRRELNEQINEQVEDARQTAASQLAATRQELAEGHQQTHKEQSAALAKLGADFDEKLRKAVKDLTSRIDRLEHDLIERLLTAQEESQGRDNDLRQELLTISAWLDDKKASRRDLGTMLVEIGEELRQENIAKDGQPDSDD